MSQINLSDRVLSRIIERVAETARANPATSKSALLNIAAAEVAGPGHDWGLLKNAAQPVTSRDLTGKRDASAKKETVIPVKTPAGYRYDLSFTFVTQELLDISEMDIIDIHHECDEGEAVGGVPVIKVTALDRESRNALAEELGSDETFFYDDSPEDERVICSFVAEASHSQEATPRLYRFNIVAPEDVPEENLQKVIAEQIKERTLLLDLEGYDILVREQEDGDAEYENTEYIFVTDEMLDLAKPDMPSGM